ncbi:MAG: beta-ketoacyl synthase, partial [Deltaproteobacteria bacterium]|nr:beta-ketoacyl synthase [Deltaproteobacteria bacterium]
ISLNLKVSDLSRVGVFLGSSAIDYSLAGPLEENVDPAFIDRCERKRVGAGGYLDSLMRRQALTGPALTCNTACTSSANALITAAALLSGGLIDHALVLGLELYSPTTLEGFAMLQLLSPTVMRPFDRDRTGIVLGEAIGAVLLSREEVRPSPWRYLGGVSRCETYSVSGTDPSGAGLARVMRDALQNAGLKAEDISAVKAHATASELNDRAEMRALAQVFRRLPPVVALKPYIGHTLGACGATELALLMESVAAGFLPATLNFSSPENEFSTPPLQEPLPINQGVFMLNYFGFGGNNTVFIVERTA